MKLLRVLVFLSLISMPLGQWNEGYTEYDDQCYFDDDLDFLSLLIYINDIEFELFYDIGLTIWQNGRINTLLLEGMGIYEIPNNIQNLDSLVNLSFSDNELDYIPDEIGNLTSLNTLILSNNVLVEIPETIENLGNLEFFHLQGNQLTELPLSISNISRVNYRKIFDFKCNYTLRYWKKTLFFNFTLMWVNVELIKNYDLLMEIPSNIFKILPEYHKASFVNACFYHPHSTFPIECIFRQIKY